MCIRDRYKDTVMKFPPMPYEGKLYGVYSDIQTGYNYLCSIEEDGDVYKRQMLHVSNHGTPTIIIGVPVRYIHSHHGFTTYQDFENSVKLAYEIMNRLNQSQIDAF